MIRFEIGERDSIVTSNEPLIVVALLTIRPGATLQFHEFESHAARILARFGAVIERTITLEASSSDDQREIHVVCFPSKEAFDAYRIDPELASLSELRAASIAHTELWIGREGPPFSASSHLLPFVLQQK